MSVPKGKLVAIGGNVDKGSDDNPGHIGRVNFFEAGILQRILSEIKGRQSLIEVVTTASMIPEEVGESYIEAFSRLGATNVRLMHIKEKKDTTSAEYLGRLQEADGVMFTGGNQTRLSEIWGGTELLKTLHQRYHHDHLLIAGTSAGAMAKSNTMICGGESSEALFKGAVKMGTGFAFVKNIIIDTHFVVRGRFGRLAQAVASHPGSLGIGLGEDTGILITSGHYIETIGSGLVLIFDGQHIRHNNIADLPEGFPISIENLMVHVLAKGNCYDVNTRTFIPQTEFMI
jgi:cyanophycinase